MVTRVFVGDDEQYFPDLGRWVAPGDEVEFDEEPNDQRFQTASAAKKTKSSKSDAAPEPAASEES